MGPWHGFIKSQQWYISLSPSTAGQSFCSVAIIQSGDKALRNVCAARTPKLPCPPRSYFNFLQCSATFSYMENSTGPNDELAQMLGRASQILRSYAKTHVCEYPFPNTSQTWSCPCISSSTRQQPTFACSLGQQDVSSAALQPPTLQKSASQSSSWCAFHWNWPALQSAHNLCQSESSTRFIRPPEGCLNG